MYSVLHDIMVVNYAGEMQPRKTTMLINTLLTYQEIITERKIKGVLLSIKVALYDEEGLRFLIAELNRAAKKLSVPVALSDYSVKLYRQLREQTKSSSVKLFKNTNAAELFFNPKSFKKGLRVLVYDDDVENADMLTGELAKLGYSVIGARSAEEFQKRLKDPTHDIVLTQCSLNGGTRAAMAPTFSLSRKLVENLPVFMDTAVETLVMFTGLDAKKVTHGIKAFDTSLSGGMICSVMHFKGDLEGNFVLVFPKEVAGQALEALLGEAVDLTDNAALMDGVGEFCNIITGSAKTVLSNKEIKVLFDLPKTFSTLQNTFAYIGKENGVWIDMQLDGKPFYMFVTK